MLIKNMIQKLITSVTGFALIGVFSNFAISQTDNYGEITVTGNVTVNGQPAVSSSTIVSDAKIITGANSSATVSFAASAPHLVRLRIGRS